MAEYIARWLEGLGLVQYAQAFAENKIGLNVFQHLDNVDLKELGYPRPSCFEMISTSK